MKHFRTISMLLFVAALASPMHSMAEEAGDTTVVYNGKRFVLSEDSVNTKVQVYDSDSTVLRLAKESTFVGKQEIERFYISSPIFSWGVDSRYKPTIPQLYVGFSGLSGSVTGFGSSRNMPVKTWRSSEIGIKMLDMGVWLNKRKTWNLMLVENIQLLQYRFDSHTIVMVDNQGHTYASSTGEDGVGKSRLMTFGVSTELMLKWYKYFKDPEADRVSIGLGLVWEGSNRLSNYSAYRQDGKAYATAAEHELSENIFGLKLQVSCGGFSVYAKKSFTPAFKSGMGPKCYPFSFGLGVCF